MRERTEEERLILDNTALVSLPFLPELRLHLATEVTPLWRVTEAWLREQAMEPPFWAFAWAGGQAIGRYLLDHPEVVSGKVVFDLASGSGLCALAAAKAGARRVIAVDRDPLAKVAMALNANENGVALEVHCADIEEALSLPFWAMGVDIVLAGDVCYDKAMTSLFWPWLLQRAREGARVLLGDPGRAYLPMESLVERQRYRVPTMDDVEAEREKCGVVYEVSPAPQELAV